MINVFHVTTPKGIGHIVVGPKSAAYLYPGCMDCRSNAKCGKCLGIRHA